MWEKKGPEGAEGKEEKKNKKPFQARSLLSATEEFS